MAQKRMFDKNIIDSDDFLDMSHSAQVLYFHLNMRADDEGFVNNPKRIMRMIGINDDDLKILIIKEFVIPFETGVIVIKHWRLNNYLNATRIKDTIYSKEKEQLLITETGEYVKPTLNRCLTNVKPGLNQDLIDKEGKSLKLGDIDNVKPMLNRCLTSIEENSIEENSIEYIKLFDDKVGEFIENVKITNKQYENLINIYGIEKVKETIFKMENWTKAKKKNKYDDYNRALHNWLKDSERNIKSNKQGKVMDQDYLNNL